MYRLIIADDHLRTRKGLSLSIDWTSMGFYMAGCFESGSEAIAHMKKENVDVVLTDVEMPEVSGIELADWIAKNYPEVIVVFISGHQEFEYARKALSTGVFDYILKPVDIGEIERVFRRVKERLDASPERVRAVESLCEEEKEQMITSENPVERTKKYVRKHIKRDVSLDEIAEHLHVSRSWLVKQFKQYSGETVMEYVLRAKMEHVFMLMRKGTSSPEILATEIGYNDVKYFQRVFKKYTGYSVKEYYKLLH